MQLASAMRTVDPDHIEKLADEAEARGMNPTAPSRSADMDGIDTGAVAEARREVARLRAELRTNKALLGNNPIELERAANDALSAGTCTWAKAGMTSIAQDAIDKTRKLRAEAAQKDAIAAKEEPKRELQQTIPHARLCWLSARLRPVHHKTSALCSMRGHVHGETSTAGLPSGLPPMCPLSLRR